MKRIVKLAATAAALILSIPALNAETFLYEGLYYSTLSDTSTIPMGYVASNYAGACEVVAPMADSTVSYSGNITVPEEVYYNGWKYLVTQVGQAAFTEYHGTKVDNITGITLPESVTVISAEAFENCTELTGFTIPANVTTIGAQAFKNTAITSISIPSGVTRIENDTFLSCNNLSCISLPATLTYIGSGAFELCTSLSELIIPEGVTTIDSDAFYSCSALARLSLPSTLTSIGESAFEFCVALTTLTVPNSVTGIGASAFDYCSALTSVSLGSGLRTIGEYAFANCDNIKNVSCYSLTPPSVYYNSWSCYNTAELDVYPQVTSLYKAHDVWVYFKSVTTGVESGDASPLTIALDGATVVVGGDAPTLEVYSLDGGLVYRGEATRLTLPRGEYIVRATDSRGSISRKVAL